MAGERRGQGDMVVAHYKNGKVIKGFTHDFVPENEAFHITSERDDDRGHIYEIKCCDLKGLFFVKTLTGNKDYTAKKRFDEIDTYGLLGLKIKVEFQDGEVIRGMSFDYDKNFAGFFIMPVDPQDNNKKVFVIADDLRDIQTGEAAEE